MFAMLLAAALSADQRMDVDLADSDSDDAAFSSRLREAIGGHTVHLGPGVLTLTAYPPELRHKFNEPCKRLNVTIQGTPGQTVIRGIGRPHDVLSLLSVSAVRIADVIIESQHDTPDGKTGSNGISIVGGSHDIVLDRVTVRNLPAVVVQKEGQQSRYDGSKGITIQQGAGPDRSSVVIRGCVVDNCPVAFGIDADPNRVVPASILIDRCHVEDCAAGVAVSFTAGPDVKGFRCDVLGSRFEDTPRPLIVSRASDVRFIGNSSSFVSPPALPDLWAANFGDCAIAVKGSQRVEITGNTLCDRRANTLVSVSSATGPHQPSSLVTTEPNTISR